MKIHHLQILQENNDVKILVLIVSERLGSRELWFSTPKKYEKYLCKTRMDGFVVGMLYPAMQYGEDIHVAGCVSERLLFNLNNYVIPLLLTYSPFCKRIKITADQTTAERFDCQGVGTGFSGGIDSFCTIYDFFEQENSLDYRINKLLFLNVGSHGSGKTEESLIFARKKFWSRYDFLRRFPEEIDLDFIPLDSNLHAFHSWGHLKTDILTAAAGILILQGCFKRYYYSSVGFSYEEQIKMGWRFREISLQEFCEGTIAPLLGTESLDFILHGMQYTRVEKTLRIINYEPIRRYLNVCVWRGQDSWENCSVCPKCCRTLMTLNSVGKINEFKSVFNIDKYKEVEQRFMCEQILQSRRDPFAHGNVLLAKENGVKISYLLFCFIVIQKCFLKAGSFIRKNAINMLRIFLFVSVI